jgi:phosphoribosylaminoimidazole carboxylase/phosphoribosylaminoimidazole-succinocarboxamide synthase
MASSSSSQGILGQKLFDGKTKTIYSVIDQPGLVCIYRKDHHDLPSSIVSISSSRRSSIDSGFRFNPQSNRYNTSIMNTDGSSKGILITSITTCVYEILREASIPTFYVAPHPQPDMFIAKKCTMIPILWVIRRLANDKYVKHHPGITHGHRFIPPMIETYHKHLKLADDDENFESDQLDDNDDSDLDECISSIWSYEQLLNANMNIENLKISQTDIEYMYEISCTIFDILEHIWMVKKNCQLIDLKIEFGITTTLTKEIVVANVYDIETWHILRPIQKTTSLGNDLIQENLIWINNALRDILDLNINIPLTAKMVPRHKCKQASTIDDNNEENKSNIIISEFDHMDINNDNLPLNICSAPSIISRCIIVCSSLHDVENGQKIKTTLNEIYNIQCDIRLCSIHKSTQTILKFLSNYSHEHCRPTVFITLGNINAGLAMCLSSNSQYPIIHCSLMNNENPNNLFDMNSFISHDTPLFTIVFTLSSAIQNVIQILAMNDWKLWTKQRGRRLKKYMDFVTADQQLLTTQTIKTNNGILINK